MQVRYLYHYKMHTWLTTREGSFLFYAAGQLTAPQLFLTSEAPRYQTGFRSMLAAFIAMIVLQFFLMFYLNWENRRRDRLYGKVEDKTAAQQAEDDFLDLTDKEQPNFRYAW